MRKEWVGELRFLWFLQFLLHSRAALGQGQGRGCRRTGTEGFPLPGYKRGSELFKYIQMRGIWSFPPKKD